MAPSSFASAAAGGNSTSSARTDSDNEWSRRTNGNTQTFRRPSLATTLSSSNHQRDASYEAQPARYVPPHRNGTTSDARFSKDQLLDLFRYQHNSEVFHRDDVSDLYVGGWEPDRSNGVEDANHGWQKKDDNSVGALGSEIFWQPEGNAIPLGLMDYNDEEKEIFSSSVNSPMKLITNQREAGPGRDGLPLRKISISHNASSPGGFSLNSPSATRPGGRSRRETSESYPFPSNPLASPKPRDDHRPASPPPALRRRTTDFKEGAADLRQTDHESHPLPDLGDATKPPLLQTARAAANPLTAGLGTPSSPWGAVQPSPGFAPMGAFGNFGASANITTPVEKRPGFGGGRAESRFKGLMTKESNDEIGKSVKEKSSVSNFGKPGDGSSWRSGWQENQRSDFDQHEGLSGSAALGGGEETSPPPLRGLYSLGPQHRPETRDDGGFSAFGMTSDAPLKGLVQDHNHAASGGQPSAAGAMSPTNTNPYQSPQQLHAETAKVHADDNELPDMSLHGLGGLMSDQLDQPASNTRGGLGGLGQTALDRDFPGSNTGTRGLPGLGGFGNLQGLGGSSTWGGLPGAPVTASAPRPLHTGFGESSFGTPGDLQSPSLAGLGPSSFFGTGQAAAPGAGRGLSRMGTFLKQQGGADTTRPQDNGRGAHDDQPNYGFFAPGMPQGDEPDVHPSHHLDNESHQETSAQSNQGPAQSSINAGLNQPPTAQQRTMVMPDRMRWIYRDPQGNTQGPWSGLEMHDWYKAGFFSPELLVKKFEDTEYEPLAQLIRRIGNSREPFLVPQIGIPHGQPQTNWGSGPLSTTGQPPFAASFPSFGTTLTAEQQNALERRKQEEQYLMARQKEHLAQQQMAQRMQVPAPHSMMPQQVQHQNGAHTIHGQPGFTGASQTSQNYHPGQFPTGAQGHGGPGFAENLPSQNRAFGAIGGGLSGHGPGPELTGQHFSTTFSQMDLNNQRPPQPGTQNQHFQHQGLSQQDSQFHQHQINSMLEDRARLQHEQHEHDIGNQHLANASGPNDRLNEFRQLQQNLGFEQDEDLHEQHLHFDQSHNESLEPQQHLHSLETPTKEHKSLTEQVQQAVSAKQSPASPWAKVDPALPQPFPPAPSQSPLPAPAAQRNRAHVADALHAESRSRSETPSLETPSASVAPWAKEPAEAPRGPSLKEIQELEARNAAKADALAAEARRLALEKETQAHLQAAAAAAAATPTAGLPSSSTWASAGNASPSIPSSGAAWSKVTKPVAAPTTTKSMAQIQKEEEARKRRLAVAALQAQQNAVLAGVANQVQGKRYAELAGKASPLGTTANVSGTATTGAWTTVGASGKTKTPAPAPAAPSRVVSSGTTAPVAAPAKKPISRSSTIGVAGTSSAQDDFKRWAAGELRGDLNKGVNADEFVANLLAFPNEVDIVTEAVHSVSTTIDSRHFAEEFLRRRKLAEKGVFDASSTGKSASPAHTGGTSGAGNSTNGGGWSEVAKKGPKESAASGPGGTAAKDDLSGSFKVVAAKKKGGAKR